jgi:hypothetical protein
MDETYTAELQFIYKKNYYAYTGYIITDMHQLLLKPTDRQYFNTEHEYFI